MLKNTILLSISWLLMWASCLILWTSTFAQFEIPWDTTIYTTDANEAIDTQDINSPLREGAYKVIVWDESKSEQKIWGITSSDDKITDHQTAKSEVLGIISNFINYALWLLSLVALIYLIYKGIIVLTAAWDDTKYKEWLKWVRYAVIAIAGIWLSWIIVSFIFYVIDGLINSTL